MNELLTSNQIDSGGTLAIVLDLLSGIVASPVAYADDGLTWNFHPRGVVDTARNSIFAA